jgi:GNAT superfamily N-acetyltransferase
MEIIEGNDTHAAVIAQIAEKTWPHTYGAILAADQLRYMLDVIYSQQALENVMRNGLQKFILLKDKGAFQAFASFGPRIEDPAIFKLHKIYILPKNQGKGYGTLLMNEVKERSKSAGANMLDLNVNRFNPAVHFYMKLGFSILREEDVPIGPYFMNDFVMRLTIR